MNAAERYLNSHERPSRNHIQLYEDAVLRAVIKRPHLRLPVFRLEFLALRNLPMELQDDTSFYDEFQSSLILIYRLRARARRQQNGS